jgi:hypothetical protein
MVVASIYGRILRVNALTSQPEVQFERGAALIKV